MIHLTIQDVALLANLAGCCNTVDEFVEYLNKTHAWGSTPLSAIQGHDGEFVVSYGTVRDLKYGPTDHQFTSAYNTISSLRNRPERYDYQATNVTGAAAVLCTNNARQSADYAVLLYAGLLKLSFDRSTDYRVNTVSSMLSLSYRQTSPFTVIYNTVTNISASPDKNKLGRALQYSTLDKIADSLSLRTGVAGWYSTIGMISVPDRDDKNANWVSDYTTIIAIQQNSHRYDSVLANYTTIESVKSTQHHPGGTEYTSLYTTIGQIDNNTTALGGSSLERAIYYSTISKLEHNRWDESDMPVDSLVSYNTIGRIDHTPRKASGMSVDSPVSYNTIGRIDHNRWDESDMPVDSPVSYNTIDRIFHTPEKASGMSVDSPVSYNTIGRIDHNRWDESDMPVDSPVSYNTIGRIDHNRWDESDMPVDSPVSYNTIGRIDHNRWDESDMPVDSPVSYNTIGRIDHNRWDESDMPIDSAGSYSTYTKINTQPDNILLTAVSYNSIGELYYNTPPAGKTYSYGGLGSVLYRTSGDVKTYSYIGLAQLLYSTPWDFKAYSYVGLSKLYYRQPPDVRVCSYGSVHRVLYQTPDDVITVAYTTIGSIHNIIGETGRVYGYTTIYEIDPIRSYPTVSYTTMSSIDNIISDLPVYYTTIDSVETIPCDKSRSYQTLSKLSHVECTNVHCDDNTYTWATTCFDTTLHQYGHNRPTYGISKFRVIAVPNSLHEQLVGPVSHRSTRISDIRARLSDNSVYPLTGNEVTITNEGGCMLGTHSISSVVDGTHQTTCAQISAQENAIVVRGDDIVLTFDLSSTVDVASIEISPGGCDGEPKNFPGGIRIDCFTPGTAGWYTVFMQQTLRHAISGREDYNIHPSVWKPGYYLNFPVINNSQLYLVNHAAKPNFCTI